MIRPAIKATKVSRIVTLMASPVSLLFADITAEDCKGSDPDAQRKEGLPQGGKYHPPIPVSFILLKSGFK